MPLVLLRSFDMCIEAFCFLTGNSLVSAANTNFFATFGCMGEADAHDRSLAPPQDAFLSLESVGMCLSSVRVSISNI